MIQEQKRAEQKSRITQKLYIRQMNYGARILTVRVKRELVVRGHVTFVIAREIKIRMISFIRRVDLYFQTSRGRRDLAHVEENIASRLDDERFEFSSSHRDRSISTDGLAAKDSRCQATRIFNSQATWERDTREKDFARISSGH
jgi:hypothetical protein